MGAAGVRPAVIAWGGVTVLWVTFFVFGAAVVPFATACTVGALFLVRRVASSWRVGRVLMLGFLTAWVVCTVLFWWLWGVGFDAADALRPMPLVMALYEPSFWLGAVSFVLFWGTLAGGAICGRDKAMASRTVAD